MDARTQVDYEDDMSTHHMIPAGERVHIDYYDINSHLYVTHTQTGQLGLYEYAEIVPLET
jgi:hypothetical protein